ncbi:hypothetical protein KCU95_g9638, partial [Aureobasidium melanogenum]
MSTRSYEVSRKRKRHDNDCSRDGVKRSRCEHASGSCDLLNPNCLCTAPQAHLLVESPCLGDESGLQSVSPRLIDFVIDDGWDELCETDSIPDLRSPAYNELAVFETDTPNTVYSGDSASSVQGLPMSSGTIGPDHFVASTSKIRESQQAFTIYASASISQRKYKGPSSLQAFAQWFHVNSHVLDKDLSEHFRHGLRHSEEMDMPTSLSMPALCPEWADYVDAYFQEIAPLFPVVRRENTIRTATYLSRSGLLEQNPISDRPATACVYACIALGARSKGQQGVAQAYIEAACSLTGYLTSLPYLESAQALLLIAIEHRGREKNGAAFLAVRQAISILNSMGLHRTPSYGNEHLSVTHQQTDRRIWWTAYALEKTIALEDGRPSSIHDCSFDRDVLAGGAAMHHLGAWTAFVDLAKIQSQISEGFFDQSMWRDALSFHTILEMQGHLDEALTQWLDSLSEHLKPCRSPVSCASNLLAFRTFLSFQFHHALIALHRAALTEDTNLDGIISETSKENPHHARGLQRSEIICANSARDILANYLHFVKGGCSSPLVTLNQPLLAVYVLTIYTLKHSDASSTNSDLVLLHSATYAIEKGYQQIGMPPGFRRILSTLRNTAKSGIEATLGSIDAFDEHQSGNTRCSQPVEEFIDASGFAASTYTSEGRLYMGLSSQRTSSWLGDTTKLQVPDDILIGTWSDAPQVNT